VTTADDRATYLEFMNMDLLTKVVQYGGRNHQVVRAGTTRARITCMFITCKHGQRARKLRNEITIVEWGIGGPVSLSGGTKEARKGIYVYSCAPGSERVVGKVNKCYCPCCCRG
jgi:hypothetical protein